MVLRPSKDVFYFPPLGLMSCGEGGWILGRSALPTAPPLCIALKGRRAAYEQGMAVLR